MMMYGCNFSIVDGKVQIRNDKVGKGSQIKS